MLAEFVATGVFVAEFGAHFFYSVSRVGILRHALEPFVERGKVLVAQVFKTDILCAGTGSADELVELDLDGFAVTILRVLDEEYHQEGDNGGASIDDELPCIGEIKQRSGDTPNEHDSHCAEEYTGRTGKIGDSCRCPTKRFFHGAFSITLCLWFWYGSV